MSYVPKNWQDLPSTATPIDANSLVDLETRVTNYTDQQDEFLVQLSDINVANGVAQVGSDGYLGTPGHGGTALTPGTVVVTGYPSNGQIPEWNSSNNEWVPASISGGGGGIGVDVIDAGNLGATYSLALSASVQQWLMGTLNANLAITVTGIVSGASALLFLTQDGTGYRTLTINSTSVSIPVTAGGSFVLQLNTDGTNLYVSILGGSGSSSGGGGSVSSVFGRTGTVTSQTGDYTVGQITGAAPLASPALTGTPTTPTATAGTNTTQAASTAFVTSAVAVETTRAEGVESTLATASALNNETTRAETVEALKAPLASPTFTGTPVAPTAAVNTSTTQLATTAFVLGQVATATPAVNGTGAVGTSTLYARQDHVHPTDTSRAPLTALTNIVGTSGSAQTIPAPSTATINRITLTAACTLTFPTAVAGESFTLQLVENGTGGYAITWPGSNIVWVSGSAPTLATGANKRNLLSFTCFDGTNWEGVQVSSSSGY